MNIVVTSPGPTALVSVHRQIMRHSQQNAAIASDRTARGAKAEMVAKGRAAGLGLLPNAIQVDSDLANRKVPGVTRPTGWNVSGWLYTSGGNKSRAALALQSYTNGAFIRARNKRWLAFPVESFFKRAGQSGEKITPALYNANLASKYGRLQFVPSKKSAGVAYLWVVGAVSRKSGRIAKNSTRNLAASTPAFILIRATRRAQRLPARQIASAWARRFSTISAQVFRNNPWQGTRISAVQPLGGPSLFGRSGTMISTRSVGRF